MKPHKIVTDKSQLYEYSLVIFIIFVGSVLRFWNLLHIPFMHDELSALSRLQFDNFTDLIRNGVMLGDTHPAGVQVFLYYWTSFVGTNETMVKLPTIFSGIISIWLGYLIGKLWFGGTTGLLTAVYISSLQFFVMYSQIARPYVSGLMLTLLMVYFWSLYFFKNKKTIYLILYVLFGALASYNHHFSLLFAAIVGVSGLFLVRKKDLITYGLSGVAIFILYIPHLHIFLTQLAKGGIGGWLSKPEPDFFFQFLNYIFHFSWWTWLAIIAVLFYIILKKGDIICNEKAKQKRWLLIVWVALPIIIGYGYSVLRNPIIQYSMLIFSTPYLFVLLFSYHKKLSDNHNAIIVTVLLIVNISTLIYGRDHYEIFYKQPYQEMFKTALVENNANDIFLIDDCIPYYHEYYFNKYGKKVPYFTKRNADIDLAGFEKIVAGIKENIVVAEAVTGEELQVVQLYFPYQIGYEYGFTYEIYTFSKNKPLTGNEIKRKIIALTDFENELGKWRHVSNPVVQDTLSGFQYYCLTSSDEWGPAITFSLPDIAECGRGIFDVELEIMMPDTITKALIVASVSDGDETMYWKAINIEDYNPEKGKWKKVFLSIDIQDALKSRTDMEGLTLKIYIWNPVHNKLLINYINIYRRTGNPYRYGLYQQLAS